MLAGLLEAQALEFTARNDTDYAPTLLGNGYLFSATARNGAAAASATLAGFYDHLQENSYAYQPLIPAWSEVDYFNGTHWLNQGKGSLDGYAQTLDAGRGLLVTRYSWLDSNHSTAVEVTTFPARQNGQLGVVRFSVTPDYGVTVGPVTFSFPLGGETGEAFAWEGAKLPGAIPITKVEADSDGRGFLALSETRDHRTRAAEAVRVILPADLPPHQALLGVSLEDPQHPRLNVKVIVQQGRTYTFTKLVAVTTSQDSVAFVEQARALAGAAEREGYESLLAKHEAAWRDLWTADIRIQGDPEAQRAVHAAMFYLMESLRAEGRTSVPAVALPSRAYLGRVWWDADTFVFPSVVVLHPELARSMAAYRCDRLAAARRNAETRGYRGALFPMESAGSGQEEAPEWSSEIHVSGDVALAQWRYFLDTGDRAWLRECGYPVLRDVADFWASRVAGGHIRAVTGPNEAITHVDDDSYTNAMARRVMEVAAEAAGLVGETPNPEWSRLAPQIAIPFDAQRQVHLEHAGDEQGRYAHALILLSYPLDLDFPEPVKRNDLTACLKNFGKPGYEVGMLGNFYSVVAAELGDGGLAWRLFESTLASYAKPPFYAMSETPANNRFVFLTAEGAFLQQVLFGFTGLRFSRDGLSPKYPPQLPPAWQSLELHGVNVKGARRNIRIERGGKLTIE